ncbi:MAG: aspartyl protease [Candidatus Rokubacteria bacterium]|nr:aspartyl protease [Candidatus Rokubacteria bacterium]
MGLAYVVGTVTGPGGSRTLNFLIDSGAKYSVLPEEVWRALRLSPKRRMDFILADGTVIERDISECHIQLPQGDGHTPVVLGQGEDEPLLGVVTLEMLGFILWPFDRTIRPARMMLA